MSLEGILTKLPSENTDRLVRLPVVITHRSLKCGSVGQMYVFRPAIVISPEPNSTATLNRLAVEPIK